MRNLHVTFVLYVVPVKSKVEILQNFVAYSEYMNFKTYLRLRFLVQLEAINGDLKICQKCLF